MTYERQRKVLYKIWRIVAWCLVLVWVIYGMPAILRIFRPDLITRIETMLHGTTFANCVVKVERDDEVSILVTVMVGEDTPITTEVSKYELNKLSHTNQQIVYITHTINQHPDESFYLTQTQIWADADLKKAKRIDVKYCDRLSGDSGSVTYDGPLPVFECAVPVAEATCVATVPAGP